MALARMQKVRLIGHDSVREAVMAVLQDLGVLQISDLTGRDEGSEGVLGLFRAKRAQVEELEQKLSEIKYVLDFIARFEPKAGLLESLTNPKAEITADELEEIVENYDYKPVYERARALDLEPAQLRSELAKLEALRNELLPWAEVAIPIEELRSSHLVAFVAGRLPRDRKKLEGLKGRLREELAGLVFLHEAGVQGNRLCIYAFMPSELEDPFLQLAGELGFERIPAPFAALAGEFRGSPREILAELDRRIEGLSRRREELLHEAEALVVEKLKLQALYQHFHDEFLRRAAQQRLIGSPNTFILEGWVRAADFPRLKEAIEKNVAAEEVYLEPIEPEPGERPPVVLENRPLFRPAEMVVRLFGLPRPGELDPTPFVAPFFALFFGVALTDAGYGLALMVIFSLLKRKFRGESFRRFANLLIMGGFVALVAGALTGGWFGPELAGMVPFLRKLQLFDVSGADGLIAFLGLTMVFGFFQVLLGHLLELWDLARAGRFKEGLFREGSWALFLLGLGLFAGIGIPPMLGLEGLPQSIAPLANTLLLLGFFAVMLFSRADPERPWREQIPWLVVLIALMLMMKGPALLNGAALGLAGAGLVWAGVTGPGKGWGRRLISVVKRLGSGLFRLYGATGFLGDMLSYARIMALGVATGLIAMSINTFATVLGGVLPGLFGLPKVVGIVVAALIIMFGQPFSLVINSLSAFVHSARLQYVEFFTKFYESGGDRFRPFAKEPVFYEVKES
ncbi:MAG: V-type ATP synthase subunit I [Candidatus Acetothermia bacterium]|jgi:V/A-type H+-transporting ATPase subunit I|nr:V-type ATP synthase subunit I [Candidatus Acetothermia bacterium]MDH7505750.1 V-type ATP synthase subunit I [Candidatus Acetothermia bacterium]